mmetsp:Transcript_17403/g.34765  ORF Transcript_17403/g.34765 Transcript_17403/m.34765 type:complete len:109 (+) Transcript_17403:658-984(+)
MLSQPLKEYQRMGASKEDWRTLMEWRNLLKVRNWHQRGRGGERLNSSATDSDVLQDKAPSEAFLRVSVRNADVEQWREARGGDRRQDRGSRLPDIDNSCNSCNRKEDV